MRKRTYDSTLVQRQNRKSGKKVCDLGRSCPYQEEYQHLMEFSHDCDPTPRAPPIRPFGAFSGSGKLLGAGSGARGEDFHTRQQLPAWEDSIRCEVCSQKVAIHMIEAHLRTHDKSSKSLKSDQDVEYEQSVMNDIQRQSELEATRQKELKEQQDAKEAAELKEVLQKSILASNIAARQQAVALLQPEPGPEYDGDKIVLKFSLPKGTKLKRVFKAANSVQDAFIFLRTFEELEGFDFALRDAVNTVVLEPNEARTFVAAGVSSHLSLIVTEACRRDSISSEPETSTSSIAVSSVTTGSSSSSNSRASGGDRSNHTSSGSSGGPSSSNVATSGPSSSRSVRGGDVIADRESGVIVLDESLEVTPKVRRKGNSSAIDVHSTGEGVIDLTFS